MNSGWRARGDEKRLVINQAPGLAVNVRSSDLRTWSFSAGNHA